MLLAVVWSGLMIVHSSLLGDEAEITGEQDRIAELLADLTSANFLESLEILQELELEGGRSILPLMDALQAGELYYNEGTRQVMSVADDEAGVTTGYDTITGASLGPVTVSELGRIRVNNRLRAFIRDGRARVNLLGGDAEQRESAAREMIRNRDDANALPLREALEQEEVPAVRTLIEVAVAMDTLVGDYPQADRIDAAVLLGTRLESSVRNLLRSMLDELGFNEQDPQVRAEIESSLTSIDRKVTFYSWVEEVFYGLSLGSVLLLAALGLAVTFGVMGVINMAHGEMIMLGAYTTYVVQMIMPEFINLSLWVAIPAAFVVSGAVGMFIQRFVIRYLNGRPLETLLATFGISLILQQTVRTIFSPLNRRVVAPDWMSGSLEINPVLSLTNSRVVILVFSILVFVALLLILKKTYLGLQVRAVTQNRDMAKAMGIRTDRVDALTFGLGSGVAGIAGVSLSQLTNVGPNLGQAYIIDSFMVVVFGGVGNLLGVFFGAFSIGMGTKFIEPFAGAVLAKIIILVFIIVFIQFRPQGLFPHKGRSVE